MSADIHPVAREPVSDFGSPVLAAAPHRIGQVSLVVHELELLARFYEEVLGLAVLERSGSLVRLGAGERPLLELRRISQARRRSQRDAGLFHTAFLLPRRADLGTWLGHVAERRVPLHGASDHGVSEAIYLADPEGNGIEVYVDKPASAWEYEGSTLKMVTEALDLESVFQSGIGRRWSGYPADGIVGHVHLQVGALAEADQFYSGVLGFDITCRYPGASFFGSGGYHHQLAANIWNSRGARPRTEPATGLAGFELVTREASTVEAARRRAEAAGLAVKPRPEGFSVPDPWGTEISLVKPA